MWLMLLKTVAEAAAKQKGVRLTLDFADGKLYFKGEVPEAVIAPLVEKWASQEWGKP